MRRQKIAVELELQEANDQLATARTALDDALAGNGGNADAIRDLQKALNNQQAEISEYQSSIAAMQAQAVADALQAFVPAANPVLERLQAELAKLDARFAAAFAGWSDAGVLYSHPVYQYLDARFRLGGWSVSWEPGEDPGEAEWQRLTGLLQDQPVTVMLWEAEPLPATITRLSELGITSVVFEVGARAPAGGDYLALMERNIERLNTVKIHGVENYQP